MGSVRTSILGGPRPLLRHRRADDRLYTLICDEPLCHAPQPRCRCEDGRALINERFLAGQGQADGRGFGRNAYAVRLVRDCELGAAGTLVGTSSLMEASLANESIHLGSTLYGSRWWGGVVNPEAKLLLLSHCFDACGYHRVKIQTDLLNTRSQAAIAKLGAQREGVLRGDMKREDGTWRGHRRVQRPRRRVAGRQGWPSRAPQRLSVHVTRTARRPGGCGSAPESGVWRRRGRAAAVPVAQLAGTRGPF